MIRITCTQHLFRRAGVAHPEGTTEYPDDRFTEDQLKLLRGDPRLKVEVIKDKAKDKNKAKA